MNFFRVVAVLALIFLFCLDLVTLAAGSGPDTLARPPVWNFTMAQCSLFRNEAVLRPFFYMWPESIKDVPFRYCCEYQPSGNLSPTSFNLSLYSNGPGNDSNTLIPAPYYDLGTIDKNFSLYTFPHFGSVGLPFRLRSPYRPPLYCEASDLYRLYKHRLGKASLQALKIAAVLASVLVVFTFVLRLELLNEAKRTFGVNIPPSYERELKKVPWGALFLDLCHLVLLAFVGTFLIEAIGHSDIREWRSQLMYNSGFVYLLLTIIAISNGAARIAMNTEKPDKKGTMVELQLKKVFAQLAALFMMCTYLSLVEDVTGRRLDAVAGLTLGVVLGAAGFSVMENEVLAYAHTIIRIINRRVPIDTECRICKAPKCEICCHERAAQRMGAGMTGS